MRRQVVLKLFLLSLSVVVLIAVETPTTEMNATETEDVNQTLVEQKLQEKRDKRKATIMLSLERTVSELEKEGVLWQKSYDSYKTYLEVLTELKTVRTQIDKLSKNGSSFEARDELNALEPRAQILANQINLLQGEGKSPFKKLLIPDELPEAPEVTNPLAIFTALSYIKIIEGKVSEYLQRESNLREYIIILRKKARLSAELSVLTKSKQDEAVSLEDMHKLTMFEGALETVRKTSVVYAQRIDAVETQVQKEIKAQTLKLFNLGIIVLILFVLFFLAKLAIKKYITDNERIYMAHKILTFANVTLIFIIVAFSYIDNVGYIVTVLGFASAGIAIAMKDWFMSMLGWLVIVLGGALHVGDRIRVDREGMKYVGDVLDISLLRITILEDITLTSYMTNRRAGRIIFIPNNYIFTHMIANYTHVSLKTVWYGIDILITFDSNHKKATHIAKEITRKYSKGYTDITRTQLNKLRNRYSLKNTNVEPRVFSFIESGGMNISAWYLTNAYATLTLRSTISSEIVDAFIAADDIQIAYPTQTLHLNNADRQMPDLPPVDENDNQSKIQW